MKLGVLFAYSALFVVAPAMAAMDANSCAAKSKHMKVSEQQGFMKSCLQQVSSPSNVKEIEQQRKRSVCEQNAKNLKEQGADKNKYVTECMTKNEAAEAAAEVAANTPTAAPAVAPAKEAPAKAARASASHKAAKPAKSCSQQAAKKGLKGDALKKFMKSCQG